MLDSLQRSAELSSGCGISLRLVVLDRTCQQIDDPFPYMTLAGLVPVYQVCSPSIEPRGVRVAVGQACGFFGHPAGLFQFVLYLVRGGQQEQALHRSCVWIAIECPQDLLCTDNIAGINESGSVFKHVGV